MDTKELDKILDFTLSDSRLSRGEKQVLSNTVTEMAGNDPNKLAFVRHRAFEAVRRQLTGPEALAALEWLEEVVKVVQVKPDVDPIESEACFSPRSNCVRKIQGLLLNTRNSVDICVFTITDDRITQAIVDAHERRVKVRIISDDDKSLDPGSDIYRLKRTGIEVHTDRTTDHMHHKYAVFDNQRLMTGSYNWTRSAAMHNEENFIVTNDPKLVGAFHRDFQRLWDELK